MWARLFNTGLGLWLMASPTVLGYGSPASTNDRIVGPVIASLAVIAIAEVTRSLRRVNTVVGGWLLLAPWILGYETLPMVQSLVVGVLVIALSLVPGEVKERYGGGWRVLWKGVGEG